MPAAHGGDHAAAALKGETVDAALLPISTARALVDSGGAKFLGWVGDETPWQLGAVFAAPKTLGNTALVTRLLGALARADREYHDVILASVKDGKPTLMAAFGKQLNDVELAAVITFTRNNWGNKTGEAIQPAEVKALRK